MTSRPARLEYAVVDVFTRDAFGGNPLAVVFGADLLSTVQCQVLAREFNLSETAFPMASALPGADYRLRIFTPAVELPFAGHPSVGTAWVQRERGLPPRAGRFVQDCLAGPLQLEFLASGAVELTGADPVVRGRLAPPLAGALLDAVGLGMADVDPVAGPRVAGTGSPFAILPVRSDAVVRATPGPPLAGVLETVGAGGVLVVSFDPVAGRAHARMFAPGLGVVEDPATGSAATAYGAFLVAAALLPGEGDSVVEMAQGAELGRPSQLTIRVSASVGRAVASRVAGHVAPVAEGTITVPG